MTRRTWVRLDNASNIFLAARTDTDPKVFRISAELDHEVDADRLQQALDLTYDRYRLYHAVLRSGIFWYYLQDSDLRPVVTGDDRFTCAPIYQPDRRTLLFRVMHHRQRVILEIFHALSDGTGALWFLSDLVAAYIRLGRHGEGSGSPAVEMPPEPTHELTTDSFAHYFRRHRWRRRDRDDDTDKAIDDDSAFVAAASSAVPTVEEVKPPSPRRFTDIVRGPRGWQKVHRVRGTRTPDNRPRLVELTVSTPELLALARAEGVSLTMYLTAVFFEAIRRSSGDLGTSRTMVASVPVNLRQFFPSTSARNFFATIRVAHTFGEGADDLGSMARELDRQFRPEATPDALEQRLRRLIHFERMVVLRIVPRPLKDLILGWLNLASNRGLTVAVSNLGRVTLPEVADPHVRRMLFHVSAVRPQFCAMSHGDQLTISFTSPFVETDHVREFARLLTQQGIAVTVATTRVTEDELAMSTR